MRYLALLPALMMAALGSPALSVEFIKCNALEGKTLYATFGHSISAGDSEPVYYPIEVVVFSEPYTLRERIIFPNTKGTRANLVGIGSGKLLFKFPTAYSDGSVGTEFFDLHLHSPRNATDFDGTWISSWPGHPIVSVKVYCSVY